MLCLRVLSQKHLSVRNLQKAKIKYQLACPTIRIKKDWIRLSLMMQFHLLFLE